MPTEHLEERRGVASSHATRQGRAEFRHAIELEVPGRIFAKPLPEQLHRAYKDPQQAVGLE
jgi:hypothetical protein